jgi:hypothetical protein
MTMINHAADNGDWEQETGAKPVHPRFAAGPAELYRAYEAVCGICRSGDETRPDGFRSFYTGLKGLCPQPTAGPALP